MIRAHLFAVLLLLLCVLGSGDWNPDALEARATMLELGLLEEPRCARGAGMLVVSQSTDTSTNGHGVLYMHPDSVLILDFDIAGRNRTCFSLGSSSSLSLGSSFLIPDLYGRMLEVRVANAQSLKEHFTQVGLRAPEPPCYEWPGAAINETCAHEWNGYWSELRTRPTLGRLPVLLEALLLGPSWVKADKIAVAERIRELQLDNTGAHLERMNAISRALGEREALSRLLGELLRFSDERLLAFIAHNRQQSYCDFLTLVLATAQSFLVRLHVHSSIVPRCNGYSIHDHPGVFASYAALGQVTDNIYVGVPWVGEPSSLLEPLRFERDEMRYQRHGCDSTAGPQPDGAAEGPLHVGAFSGHFGNFGAGSHATWGVMRHVACESYGLGDSHIFPKFWMHRPRLAPKTQHALSLVVYDFNSVENAALPGPAYEALLRAEPDTFRREFAKIVQILRSDAAAGTGLNPVLRIQDLIQDAGIPKFHDSLLGDTDDDDGHEQYPFADLQQHEL